MCYAQLTVEEMLHKEQFLKFLLDLYLEKYQNKYMYGIYQEDNFCGLILEKKTN